MKSVSKVRIITPCYAKKWKGNAKALVLKTEPQITKSCVQEFDSLIPQGPSWVLGPPDLALAIVEIGPISLGVALHASCTRLLNDHDRLSNPPARVGCCAGTRVQGRCPLHLSKAGVCANPLGSCGFKSKIYVTNKCRYLYCIHKPHRSPPQ